METKPYGKFTLEQLKQLLELVDDTRHLAPTLEKVLREAGVAKVQSILGETFSWIHFYEMPFKEHIAWSLLVLDWQDEIRKAARSDDPQQYVFDFFRQLDFDDEWKGGYQGKFEKRHLLEVVISIFRTMKSIMIYHKSLSKLVEEAGQGDDKALFDAIRIDRSIVGCAVAKHRISYAEMTGDKKFFLHLRNALKGPNQKHWVGLEEMRYMMKAIVDTGGDRVSGENLEQLFVEHLKLYPSTSSAQKNLQKHFLESKKSTT